MPLEGNELCLYVSLLTEYGPTLKTLRVTSFSESLEFQEWHTNTIETITRKLSSCLLGGQLLIIPKVQYW